jgi:acetyl-CoA carboxylase carboxyl transferase subunit beta
LGWPVVALVDTPGAFPGATAEEHGQAMAISDNLRLMAGLRVPVVSVVIGEGGSGGALALALADRVLMRADSVYSVISPEGCAAILWNDASRAPAAADALGLDAPTLLRLGVVDAVIPDPPDGDPTSVAAAVRSAIVGQFDELLPLPADQLIRGRRARFRKFGVPTPTDPTEALR